MRKHPVRRQTSRELGAARNSEDSEEEGSDKVPKHRDRLCTGIFMPPSKEAQDSADDSAA